MLQICDLIENHVVLWIFHICNSSTIEKFWHFGRFLADLWHPLSSFPTPPSISSFSSSIYQAPPGRPPGSEPWRDDHFGLCGIGRRTSSQFKMDETRWAAAPQTERGQRGHADHSCCCYWRRWCLQLCGVQQRWESCQKNHHHPGQR